VAFDAIQLSDDLVSYITDRRQDGMTVSQVADSFGVSRSTIYRWSNGGLPSPGNRGELRHKVDQKEDYQKRKRKKKRDDDGGGIDPKDTYDRGPYFYPDAFQEAAENPDTLIRSNVRITIMGTDGVSIDKWSETFGPGSDAMREGMEGEQKKAYDKYPGISPVITILLTFQKCVTDG